MAKLSLNGLTDIDGFIAAALVDSESGLAMATQGNNDCQTITLDAENGKALLTAISHPQHPMILVVLTSKNVLLGQLLYSLKRVSNELSEYQLSNTFA